MKNSCNITAQSRGDCLRSPPSLPFTVFPKRARQARLILASIAFVAIGICMVRNGEREFWGWCSIVFFGLGALVGFVNLYPGSAFLTVSEDGIEYCALFCRHRFHWSDILEFGTYSVTRRGRVVGRLVAFNFSPEYQSSPRMFRISKAMSGFEGGLPDTYGFQAEQLAELLTFYHAQRVPQGRVDLLHSK